MSSLLVFCFLSFVLFFSTIVQDIYHAEKSFRGIWFLTDFADFPKIHDIWYECEKKERKKKWHENSLLHPRDDNNYHFSDGLPFFSRWSQSAFKTECEENGGKRQIILKTQNCVEKTYFESLTRF